MTAYRRVCDSRHRQANRDLNRDQLPNPTLGNRVWATFTFFVYMYTVCVRFHHCNYAFFKVPIVYQRDAKCRRKQYETLINTILL